MSESVHWHDIAVTELLDACFIMWSQLVAAHNLRSYLLLLSALQIPPLLCYVAEVHLVHGYLDVADGIVLGEAVKIVDRHHQRLPTQLYIWDLKMTE